MPRKPTPAQSESSRLNGCKSRGPKSSETKQKSAQNARKFGLFAKTVALPHELPEWAERSNLWHTYYQPRSPASMHLTNECARATLMADRCESYRQSTIEKQTQAETQKFHVAEKRKASHLAREIRILPESTVQKLGAFGEGARSMGLVFEDLIDIVRTEGHLPKDALELAILWHGVAPTRERITQDVMAYVINLYNLGCTPGVPLTVIEEWLRPENRPDVLQGVPDSEVVGYDADENRELLLDELEGARDRLYAEAERLTREVDLPRLVAALERASILTEKAAKRVARSHSEARSTYHRASNALWPLLDREKEEGLPEIGGEATPTRPATQPVPGSRVGSLNPRRRGFR